MPVAAVVMAFSMVLVPVLAVPSPQPFCCSFYPYLGCLVPVVVTVRQLAPVVMIVLTLEPPPLYRYVLEVLGADR